MVLEVFDFLNLITREGSISCIKTPKGGPLAIDKVMLWKFVESVESQIKSKPYH